jgi:hypothetical protein
MVFFNSFLTAPFELSVIFLPSEKLAEIYNYLSKFDLPESNEIEKYNKSVFIDYLKYIKLYEEKNRNGIDYSEQKDNYSQVILSERSTRKKSIKSKDELYDAILNKNGYDDALKRDVIKKLEELFFLINNSETEKKIMEDISASSLDTMIRDVNHKSKEELFNNLQKKYLN